MSYTLVLFFFLQILFLSSISKTNGLTLEMIPIDSPHLQIVPQYITTHERHQFLANISMSRVNNYPINHSNISPNSFKSPLFLAKTSFYVVKLAFGTGNGLISPFLLLDTACDETWVQCEGCNPCMEIQGKNFSYKSSPSFVTLGVNDPMCDQASPYMGSCRFILEFAGASSIGFVGKDNFYFQNSRNGQVDIYNGLVFLCGIENRNFVFGDNRGPTNVIAGIHGLAPGPRSFLTQLSAQIKGRFSYCLLPWTPTGGLSYMYFGDDAQISGDDTRKVQTISMYNMKRYHLYLNGISVDGTRVPIDPSIFELDPVSFSKGFIIDSGSPYTYLAKSAYNPLKSAIINYFNEQYGWQPTTEKKLFDLCYMIYPDDGHIFPSVIFHFKKFDEEEIDWVLEKDNMFQMMSDKTGFCMVIFVVNDPGPNIFGAYQQVNFRILYDVANGLLSFVPDRCQEAA